MFLLIVVCFPINFLPGARSPGTVKLRPAEPGFANLFMDLGVITTTINAAMHRYWIQFGGFLGEIPPWSLVCMPMSKFRFGENRAMAGLPLTWIMAFTCSVPCLISWSHYIPEAMQRSCGGDCYTVKPL